MKKIFLWLLQSFFYLVPILVSVIGAYFIVRFVHFYTPFFVVLWIVIIAYLYIRYSKWI